MRSWFARTGTPGVSVATKNSVLIEDLTLRGGVLKLAEVLWIRPTVFPDPAQWPSAETPLKALAPVTAPTVGFRGEWICDRLNDVPPQSCTWLAEEFWRQTANVNTPRKIRTLPKRRLRIAP